MSVNFEKYPVSVLVSTHTNVRQPVPLRRQIERDAVHVSGQRGGAHQEYDQDAVGEQGREVHQL